MPTIKREPSPEAPIAAVATARSPNIQSLADASFIRPIPIREGQDVKPSMPTMRTKPHVVAQQMHLHPGAYGLAAPSDSSVRASVCTPPVFPRLLSRRHAIATARVNKTTAVTTTSDTITPRLQSPNHLTHNADEMRFDTMDESRVGNEDVFLDEETVTLSRTEMEELQYHVHMLQNAHAASEEKGQSPSRGSKNLEKELNFLKSPRTARTDAYSAIAVQSDLRIGLVQSAHSRHHRRLERTLEDSRDIEYTCYPSVSRRTSLYSAAGL
jgi:hypothetical protein